MQKSEKKTLFSKLRWFIPAIIIVLAVVITVLFTASKRSAVRQTEENAVAVKIIKPQFGSVSKTINLNAYVESDTMVTVLPLVAGVLEELYIDVGQYVNKDEIIAKIESKRFELQFKQAEAAYLSAKSTYDRLTQLYKANATSQQNYDQAKGQYEAYSSQYQLAKLQLDYASIKSPVSGVVLMKHLPKGSLAAPERPLVTIGDLNNLVIKAKVPERYYEKFSSDKDKIAVKIGRKNASSYVGKIQNVSPFVSAETKNFEVVISVLDPEKALRPGMFVSLEFELERWDNVYYLPYDVLSVGNKLWFVKDNRAHNETFIPQIESDFDFVVPAEKKDTEFIIEGHNFVKENSPVNIMGESK